MTSKKKRKMTTRTPKAPSQKRGLLVFWWSENLAFFGQEAHGKCNDFIHDIEINVKKLGNDTCHDEGYCIFAGNKQDTEEGFQAGKDCQEKEYQNERSADLEVDEKECPSLFCPTEVFDQKAQAEDSQP